MVLNELIFDPTSLEGSTTFSVVQGVFVFVSGEIAAHNPDEMVIRTPVATLGIRGTKVGGRAATEGEINTVTVMPEEGGAVTVSTGLHDFIKDFTTGSDTIQLSNTAFNLGGSLVNNINFVSLGVAYKGSNFGITSGVSHVIVDINGTVDHDADSAVVGYTVIAETDNTTPTISDFSLV